MSNDENSKDSSDNKATGYILNREDISNGSYAARLRKIIASIDPHYEIPTDADLAAAQADFLDGFESRDTLWVFGYGSLMWNPAIEFVERRKGVASGWSRRFNLWLTASRGTVERPGLMLGLQKGGEAAGVLLRLDQDPRLARQELSYIWQREALSGLYVPQWIYVSTDTETVRAVTFISNIHHKYYEGNLSDEEVAKVVAQAAGFSGSCRAYLEETLNSITILGMQDIYLQTISSYVDAYEAASTRHMP